MARVIAGRLRHRVQLQKRTQTTDTVGEPQLAWEELGSVWADIQPMAGRKLASVQRLGSSVSHEIVVRYQAKFADTRVVSTYRGLYQGRIFNILGCINSDEGQSLVSLIAEEGLSEV